MKTNPGEIPDHILDLLALSGTGKIGPDQASQLDEWIKAHPETEQEYKLFIEQMQKHYWAHLSNEVELKSAWQKITDRKETKTHKPAIFRWIAAAAIFILLIAAAWYLVLTFEQKEQTNLADQPALNRSNQAVLVLSDGREHVLGSEKATELHEQGGVHITDNPGEILAYNTEEHDGIEPVMNRLKIPAGARYQLQLSDGTHVWLNAVTEIEYPVAFGNDERRIRLSGEAYFDVHTDPSKPFIIEANGYEIRVTGTSFNVSSYQNDPFMQTTLVVGQVEVTDRNGTKISLAPGQMVTVDNKGQSHTVKKVDTRFYTSWKEGILYFNKVTLYDLSVKLGRWYDADFQFADPQKRNLVYSGAMENSRDIRFLLNLIEQTADVKFSVDGHTVTVQ
ncbi:MAG: FecR domain-containing protein [Bacteroidetes bacterium]|nr:FecR domain-containing protein [Bacteroidota bacterium]